MFRIACFSFVLLFSSCIVNDTFADDPLISLEGTWRLTSFGIGNGYDLDGDGVASSNLLDETECYNNETLEFRDDNSGESVSTSYADIEVTFVAGSTTEVAYAVSCINEMLREEFTWSRNGNNITINVGGSSFNASTNINNKLSFVIPQGFSIEVPENGVLVTFTSNVTMVYTKQ